MILCIGLAADPTFTYTLAALRHAGARFDAFDFAQFVISGEMTYDIENPGDARLSIRDRRYRLATYTAAWVRLHDISSQAPSERLRRRAAGFYLALGQVLTECPLLVVNPPFADNSNFSKPYHAARLAAAGWTVPRTCVTNEPEFAQSFIRSCRQDVIFKGVSSMKTWATKYDEEVHAERMLLIRDCPVLLQERIDGPDVRVHVVGDRVFAEEIHSEGVDYRVGTANIFRRIRLPRSIAHRCRALVSVLGSPFLGIDLKREKASGEWVLLEANSMPGYEGYDARAGGAISRCLVDLLLSAQQAT